METIKIILVVFVIIFDFVVISMILKKWKEDK